MKKLFLLTKTLLVAALLCVGASNALADEIDFGSEATVSTKKVWNFNSLTAETVYSSTTEYQNGYFRRERDNYDIKVKALAESHALTLSDGTNLSVDKVITLKKTNSNGATASAASSAKGDFSSSFAFNAEVPGKVYVYFKGKSGGSNNIRIWNNAKPSTAINYISSDNTVQSLTAAVLEKGSFFIVSHDEDVDIYAVEFVPQKAVGSKTLWKFQQYPGSYTLKNGSGIEYMEYDGLYFHKTSNDGHWFRASGYFNPDIEAENFGGIELKSNMMPIQFNGTASNPAKSFTAGDGDATYDGMAFNASCAGTTYIAFRTPNASSDYTSRSFTIYFNGTAQTGVATQSYTNRGTYVVKYTSDQSGTFATKWSQGGVEIAAVLFVPTNDSATDTKTVNISSAGYATFSAARNYTVSEGLTAYKVSAVDETKATLESIGSIIPAYTGVVLAGNEGSYTLTSTTTEASVTGNSLVANVGEYALPVDNGKTGDALRYHYTLAAGPTFMHSNGDGLLAGGKAYLSTDVNVTEGGARGISLVIDESEITGIKTVEKPTVADGKIFDLQGRPVTNPGKSLYIVNGKKVVFN